MEAYLFQIELDISGGPSESDESDQILYSIFIPQKNYIFQRLDPDIHLGSTQYLSGNNPKAIEQLKNLIGKKPEYRGKIEVSEEEFNNMMNLAKKYEEGQQFTKSIDKIINEHILKD